MKVVLLTWDLHLPGCRSLKEKRTVVRSLRDRLRQRFQVSAAEVGRQDVHDRALLAAAFVAADGQTAERLAGQLERFVDEDGRARVVRFDREER